MSEIELRINGEVRQVDGGLSIAQLIEQLEVNPKQVAVEVNQMLIPREQHGEHQLESGDAVEVVTLVGGG